MWLALNGLRVFGAAVAPVGWERTMEKRQVRRLEPFFVIDVFLRNVRYSLHFPCHGQTEREKETSGYSCINGLNSPTRKLNLIAQSLKGLTLRLDFQLAQVQTN